MDVSGMSFDEFKQEVAANILDYLPEDRFVNAEVTINQITKNNGLKLEGLIVRPEGSEGQAVPTVYLNDIYTMGQERADSLEEILDRIADSIIGHMTPDLGFDISKITDYSQVADRIVPRLVNAEQNADQLKEKPHQFVADLAVTYAVTINPEASVQVTNDLFKNWGISEAELHDKAMENLNNNVEPTFRGMTEVLMGMGAGNLFEDGLLSPQDDFMYVLSNSTNMHGAAELLNPFIMDKVCERFPEGFYVLPSSIHETIIIPADDHGDPKQLAELVREINQTQLRPDEVLSDGVYQYDSETHTLSRADLEQTESQGQSHNKNIDLDIGR